MAEEFEIDDDLPTSPPLAVGPSDGYAADWFADPALPHGGTYGVRGPHSRVCTTNPYKDGWDTAQEIAAALNADGDETSHCEFCGAVVPADQYHPVWHDEGSPMLSCDSCMATDNPSRPPASSPTGSPQ